MAGMRLVIRQYEGKFSSADSVGERALKLFGLESYEVVEPVGIPKEFTEPMSLPSKSYAGKVIFGAPFLKYRMTSLLEDWKANPSEPFVELNVVHHILERQEGRRDMSGMSHQGTALITTYHTKAFKKEESKRCVDEYNSSHNIGHTLGLDNHSPDDATKCVMQPDYNAVMQSRIAPSKSRHVLCPDCREQLDLEKRHKELLKMAVRL